jgi:hypothetical protein
MVTKIFLVFSAVVCLFLLPLAYADCIDLGNFTSWVSTGPHSVLFSKGTKPLALIFVSDCVIHPLSNIVPPKARVCAFDTLMIDGKECHILNLMILD